MKKLFLGCIVLLASAAFVSCGDDDDDKRIAYAETPAEVKAFIGNHFVDFDESQIRYVEENKDGTYEIKFVNGTEIDFYPNGVWKEIDMENNLLPESIAMLLPTSALSYISEQYPGIAIEEIEKIGAYSETQGFKIELRNKGDVYFDYLGNVTQDHGNTSGGKEEIIGSVADLPNTAQEFLSKYFEGQTPSQIKKEWDKYEVEYNKNTVTETEIDFDLNGNFKSIDTDSAAGISRAIITDIASASVLEYLDANYAGQRIEDFAKLPAYFTGELKNGFKVELDGKPEYDVYFNANGAFVKAVRD